MLMTVSVSNESKLQPHVRENRWAEDERFSRIVIRPCPGSHADSFIAQRGRGEVERCEQSGLAVSPLYPQGGKNMNQFSGWKMLISSKLKSIWVEVKMRQHSVAQVHLSALTVVMNEFNKESQRHWNFSKCDSSRLESAELMGDFLIAPDVSSFWKKRLRLYSQSDDCKVLLFESNGDLLPSSKMQNWISQICICALFSNTSWTKTTFNFWII